MRFPVEVDDAVTQVRGLIDGNLAGEERAEAAIGSGGVCCGSGVFGVIHVDHDVRVILDAEEARDPRRVRPRVILDQLSSAETGVSPIAKAD